MVVYFAICDRDYLVKLEGLATFLTWIDNRKPAVSEVNRATMNGPGLVRTSVGKRLLHAHEDKIRVLRPRLGINKADNAAHLNRVWVRCEEEGLQARSAFPALNRSVYPEPRNRYA